MPTDSVRELVLANVKTTLAGIVAGATYWNSIENVLRFYRAWNDRGKAPNLTVIAGPETKEVVGSLGTAWVMQCTIPLSIEGVVSAQGEAMATATERLMEDVERALMVDIKRGGGAEWTKAIGSEVLVLDAFNGIGFTIQDFEIVYRYNSTAPEQVN